MQKASTIFAEKPSLGQRLKMQKPSTISAEKTCYELRTRLLTLKVIYYTVPHLRGINNLYLPTCFCPIICIKSTSKIPCNKIQFAVSKTLLLSCYLAMLLCYSPCLHTILLTQFELLNVSHEFQYRHINHYRGHIWQQLVNSHQLD